MGEKLAPMQSEGEPSLERTKRRKPGIIYLSSIPPNMNVGKIREYFSRFGVLDRVYLQAAQDKGSSKGAKTSKFKKRLQFTEGWIEFKSKRKAKQVHLYLNNQPVGGKKKDPYHDMLWNIKYLPRFKWAYLKQRLEYEKEVMRQRLAAEISQVSKEADHFIGLTEISQKKKRKRKKAIEGGEKVAGDAADSENPFIFKQKLTEEEKLSKKEIRKRKNELFKNKIAEKKKKKQKKKEQKPDDILGSVFVGAS